MELSMAERQRGLRALLGFTFFMVSGFTLVMPLVAVHFVNTLGWAAVTVGLALAVRQLTQQGLALVAGSLTDRIGARQLLCGGVLLRAVGFASLAWANTIPSLFTALVVSALGGALFEVPYQASIAMLTTDESRPRYYALSNLVSGVATTLGPLIGVWLLRFDFQWVCLSAAACFLVTFVIAVLVLPAVRTANSSKKLGAGYALVFRDRRFLALTALLMGYWFVAVQINISLPIMVERLTGSSDGVGVMFALNAGMTVCLQYPMIRLLEPRLSTRAILVIGVGLMALSLGAVGLVGSFSLLLGCVGFFAFGSLLTRPTQQSLTVALADSQALGTYLGVSSLALAIGGGLGNGVGGWLIDLAAAHALPLLPWIVFAVVGLVSAIGLVLLPLPKPALNPAAAIEAHSEGETTAAPA
ncbi:MFS transporter [Herpetosiphon geysericola]|uniref:MFS transporter n=2 Tax=Herpetosiphon geysericola TaxID=70996 RepID=A0A0P6Y5C8_9CHLR|nr:MFS transporter [Herpetosiphon geysericola]